MSTIKPNQLENSLRLCARALTARRGYNQRTQQTAIEHLIRTLSRLHPVDLGSPIRIYQTEQATYIQFHSRLSKNQELCICI